jgi:hypothetical protein
MTIVKIEFKINPDSIGTISKIIEGLRGEIISLEFGEDAVTILDAATPKTALDPKKVIQLYVDENKTLNEVSEYFGINKSTMNLFLTRNGIRKRKVTKERKREVDTSNESRNQVKMTKDEFVARFEMESGYE